MKELKKFPSVYQIALTHKIQADILMSSLIKNKFNERILILHDNNELSLASYLMHRFKKIIKLLILIRLVTQTLILLDVFLLILRMLYCFQEIKFLLVRC